MTTTGDVLLDIVDYGPFAGAHRYATCAPQGGETASLDTFVDVLGADFAYAFEYKYAYGDSDDPTTYVIAIEFEEGD